MGRGPLAHTPHTGHTRCTNGTLRTLRTHVTCVLKVFYIAACAVAATPTANNMMVMTEIAGGNGAAMSTAIFVQYMVAPVVLTFSLTFIVTMLHAYG